MCMSALLSQEQGSTQTRKNTVGVATAIASFSSEVSKHLTAKSHMQESL